MCQYDVTLEIILILYHLYNDEHIEIRTYITSLTYNQISKNKFEILQPISQSIIIIMYDICSNLIIYLKKLFISYFIIDLFFYLAKVKWSTLSLTVSDIVIALCLFFLSIY